MKILRRIGLYAGLALAALTFIYPFLWMASSTLKPREEFGTLALIPDHITLDNYRTMWARAPFGRALVNSTLVATTITLAVLVFGSMTAYAMARLQFRGRPVLNAATLAVLLVPGQLTLIPLYTLIVQLGWIDTYAALIVPYLFNATAILMLRQFFLQIPQSLIDSARMDGMSELRILFTIFWPLSKPVLSIVAIFTFMGAWNAGGERQGWSLRISDAAVAALEGLFRGRGFAEGAAPLKNCAIGRDPFIGMETTRW